MTKLDSQPGKSKTFKRKCNRDGHCEKHKAGKCEYFHSKQDTVSEKKTPQKSEVQSKKKKTENQIKSSKKESVLKTVVSDDESDEVNIEEVDQTGILLNKSTSNIKAYNSLKKPCFINRLNTNSEHKQV